MKHCRHCRRTNAHSLSLGTDFIATKATTKKATVATKPKDKTTGGPNHTEQRYRQEFIDTRDDVLRCSFEGLTFRLENGHKYTPDWIVITRDLDIECHEVKGKRRHPSHNRAQLAWKQARIEHPGLIFVWARLQKDNTWKFEN